MAAVPPVAAGALQLLPPAAYAHQTATSFAIKFAGQAPSKVGSGVGRGSMVGSQGRHHLQHALPAREGFRGKNLTCLSNTSAACRLLPHPHPQTRSSINVAAWTPDGRRCLTGTQV